MIKKKIEKILLLCDRGENLRYKSKEQCDF